MKFIIVFTILILIILIFYVIKEKFTNLKEINVKGDIGEFLFLLYGENGNIRKISDNMYLLEILETDVEINAYTNQPKHIRKDITLNDFVNLQNLWTTDINNVHTPNSFGIIRDKDQKYKFGFKMYKPNIHNKISKNVYTTSIIIQPLDDKKSINVIEELSKIRDLDRIYLFIDNNEETKKELIQKFNLKI